MKLLCFYFNARSLKSKLTDLHDILYNVKYDVIRVSETWINSLLISDGGLDPKNRYKIYRKDRKIGKSGGGVCIFVNNNLKSYIVDNDETQENVEIISSAVLMNKIKTILTCVYLAPNLELDDFAKSIKCLEKVLQTQGIHILVGDFNLPGINRDSMLCSQDIKVAIFWICV